MCLLGELKRDFKHIVNYILGIILALSSIVTLASSFILWFVLPMGYGAHIEMCQNQGMGFGGNYFVFWNIPRYLWIEIHNWASVALLGLIIMHLIMHRTWIVEIFKRTGFFFNNPIKKVGEQLIISILFFILFVAEYLSGFVLWLILPRGGFDYFNMLHGIGRTFWGWQRNVWVDIHAWAAVLIIAILIIHLILNWRWMLHTSKNCKQFYKTSYRKRMIEK